MDDRPGGEEQDGRLIARPEHLAEELHADPFGEPVRVGIASSHPFLLRSSWLSHRSIAASSSPWPSNIPLCRSRIIPSLKVMTSETNVSMVKGRRSSRYSFIARRKASVRTDRHSPFTLATRSFSS